MKLWKVCGLAMVLCTAGCATVTPKPNITNLTPSQLPRNADGLYLLEASWNSKRATIIKESMKPKVVIGFDEYPMKQTTMLSNRWEAYVPIPADKTIINYRFKFDFDYRAIPQPVADSKLSQGFQLLILDKP